MKVADISLWLIIKQKPSTQSETKYSRDNATSLPLYLTHHIIRLILAMLLPPIHHNNVPSIYIFHSITHG